MIGPTLGLVTVGGLAILYGKAASYAGQVKKQTLANRETCWLPLDPYLARLEYELARLGLAPSGEPKVFGHCVVCRAVPMENVENNRLELPTSGVVAALYFGQFYREVKDRLLAVLGACRRQAPSGLLAPFLLETHQSLAVALYSLPAGGSWSGQTFLTHYTKRTCSPRQSWAFLLQFGEALAFLERQGWIHLGQVQELHVDDSGRPAMVLGANRDSTRSRRAASRTTPSRHDRAPYLLLWTDAGIGLAQMVPSRGGEEASDALSKAMHAARAERRDISFGELFEEMKHTMVHLLD